MNHAQLARSYGHKNFQAFYTDAEEIRILMQELLGDVEGKKVLEPCAGEGAFLDGLVGKPSLLQAVDINQKSINILHSKYGQEVQTTHADFIDLFVSGDIQHSTQIRSDYDAIICNPPFGLRFAVEYRKRIKKKFPHMYARESYGLFLYFGIKCLSAGGRFVYIVPDTFFTSRNHAPLRNFLTEETSITDIIQFRSKRFETVNFGYGNLSIVAGYRGEKRKYEYIRWSDSRDSTSTLRTELVSASEQVPLSYLRNNAATGWAHPKLLRSIQNLNSSLLLGDIAECRTGIYTGNNKRFCAYDADHPPSRTNGHPFDWAAFVHPDRLTPEEKLHGLPCNCHYVPLIRGGHRKPFEDTRHAVNWSKDAVSFYAKDKKARLQNQNYYFRAGLAIPMVTSGRLSASIMDNSIFDQGVVGVFPHDGAYVDFLLIYLNSSIVSEYKKVLSPGANNSANYIKRIPIPIVGIELLDWSSSIVEKAKVLGWEKVKVDLDKVIEGALGD